MTPPARLTLVLPTDCERRTGGYVWDTRVAQELRRLGWMVEERELPAGFPHPDRAARIGSALVLGSIAADSVVMSDGYAFSAIPEVLAAEAGRLRLVSIVHHAFADENGTLAPALVEAERAAMAHLAHVLVPSRSTADRLQEDYGVPESRLTIAVPGTDPAPIAPGSGGDYPVLLAVGAVIPRKDHLALIEALGQSRDLPWRLRIIGNLSRFPAAVAAVRDRLAELGMAHRVELTGEIEPQALAAARDSAAFVVSASRHEGYGMALAEGIACGIPVVAVTGGAIGEWLTPDAALLVPPDDPPALALALRTAIANPALRERLREGALRLRARLPTWRETALVVQRALRATIDAPCPGNGVAFGTGPGSP